MDLVLIRFLNKYSPYNAGETAGFTARKARFLVEQGFAEYEDRAAKRAAMKATTDMAPADVETKDAPEASEAADPKAPGDPLDLDADPADEEPKESLRKGGRKK